MNFSYLKNQQNYTMNTENTGNRIFECEKLIFIETLSLLLHTLQQNAGRRTVCIPSYAISNESAV